LSARRVIVSGMIAATPGQGGAAWAILQYLLGLRRLGCEVHFVEPVRDDTVSDASARYCCRVMGEFGFEGRWALVPEGGASVGMSRSQLRGVADEAELLLNVSGMLTDVDVLERVPVRAFLDLDPAFVQLWHAAEGVDMGLDAHTHFVTIADSIGRPGSPIPDCGREWLPTLPPVVLDAWPFAAKGPSRDVTTVGHWRSYGSVHHGGVHYGQKAHSLRPLFGLPARAPGRFALALGIDQAETDDLEALRANGWRLLDPAKVAETPDDYRRFVQGSWAEFGLAKSGYVVSDSGWFSDRSAVYLASGRPAIAQDTGFGRRLPTGAGLFAVTSADEVIEALDAIDADYERHRAAAREIAVEHLDSDRVLGSLLDRLGG
jgi:hypothetical protein